VHAWKACVPKGTGGSNPPPSAIKPVYPSKARRTNNQMSAFREQIPKRPAKIADDKDNVSTI